MSDVFRVPESEADKPENRFKFEIDGETYDLPKLSHIGGDRLEVLNRDTYSDVEVDAVTQEFFGAKGTPIGDAVRTLDRAQLDALSTAYRKASGITEGESEASSSS